MQDVPHRFMFLNTWLLAGGAVFVLKDYETFLLEPHWRKWVTGVGFEVL